ncbi:MAG: CDP-glycerol glycerophosphotransferase family protein [Lachnospiraceae bacterium]|nr:CDP-glycerol glycerophosphotransferase family protein [Lachnospiraceae bacterium]
MNKLLLEIKSIGGCLYRPFHKWVNSGSFRKCARYAKYFHNKKLQNNTVLYESFFGRGMLCNPYAIFLQLLQDPAFKHFKHVWVLDDMKNHSVLLDEYSKYRNVIFVQRESKEYLKYLCSAKYLINNVTFPSYFSKKEGQIYLNTWHGIPIKHLGYDLPNGNIEVSNTVRNFLHADYLLAANSFFVDIYENAFKMREIYKGKIIKEGYPRLDLSYQFTPEGVYQKLEKYGVRVNPSKKIILFAPTWRGVSYKDANSDVSSYYTIKNQLEQQIDTDQYQILIKVHQRVYELAREELTEDFIVPAMIDANEIMGITDILISDFSSIYFDFLTTGKPILFLIEDAEKYSQERGLYFSLDKLPGPHTDSISTLADWINHIETVSEKYANQYHELQEWSNGVYTDNISQKIIDIVFKRKESEYQIIQQTKQKKHILIQRGKMLVNGISTSLLNLLNCIDYDQYDVSVMLSDAATTDEQKMVEQIHPNARVFYRNSTYNATYHQEVCRMYRQRHNIFKPGFSLFAEDFDRSYGNVDFDYAIDFEGYNHYYSNLLLQCPNAVKSIWMHNDMAAECELKYPWLEDYFPIYQYYDRIVSCSKDIMVVNRDNLAGKYAEYDKFRYAKNFVNPEDVFSKKDYPEKRVYEGQTYIMANESQHWSYITGKLLPYIPEHNDKGEHNYRFVTVGRLSPEKNHENLIYAFQRLRQKNKNVYLYIIGNGPLGITLQNLIQTLDLQDHIIITGKIENPFSVMKNCDCFILPSLHEGQPMVIHEARLLQMPIICSEFSSANGIKLENGQYMIGTTEEEIYGGMKAFLDGKVPANYVFDGEAYNREAYEEFMNAIT